MEEEMSVKSSKKSGQGKSQKGTGRRVMGRERAEGVSRRCGMKSRGSDGRAGAARVEVPEAQTNQARVSLAAAPPLQSHRENFSLVQ